MKRKEILLRTPLDLWNRVKKFQFESEVDSANEAVNELLKTALMLHLPVGMWSQIREFQYAAKLNSPNDSMIELLKIALELWEAKK